MIVRGSRLLGSIAEMLKQARGQPARQDRSRQEAIERVATLSEQQKVILEMIAEGWGAHEIARVFNIEPAMFEQRRAELFRKINARTTSEAVRLGIYAGLY